MNINASPDTINRSAVNITPGYMSGFGNSFETEALPGALADRAQFAATLRLRALCRAIVRLALHRAARQQRAFLAVSHPPVSPAFRAALPKSMPDFGAPRRVTRVELPIAQLRWDPAPIPKADLTFLQGVQTMTTAGDADTQAGMAAHIYLITKSMVDQHFYNADGEMLFVPQQGNLRFVTEFGRIDAEPGEIVVIPRGVKFRVEITAGPHGAISAKITAAPSRCRSAGRSAPIASPMRAISSPRSRPMKTRTRRPNCS